jgi:hypothetical protein
MYDYTDYLESEYAMPAGPKRIARPNLTTIVKPRKIAPARYCECGQKLSIANEGVACFICTRKKDKEKRKK